MFLVERGVRLRGKRFQVLNYAVAGLDRRFFFFKRKYKYQHNKYHHSLIPQQLVAPRFRYTGPFLRALTVCVNIVRQNFKLYGVFQSAFGVCVTMPLVDAVALGSQIWFYRNAVKCIAPLSPGSVFRIGALKPAFIVSNVGSLYGLFATAPGTFLKILVVRPSYCLVRLPSGVIASISPTTWGVIGRNAGVYVRHQIFGKAAVGSPRGLRIMVRSASKNPVDHPNGGRTRGKALHKTPWGRVAKASK